IASCIAPHIRALVTVALHSGMRLGEILNLRRHDLDFASGFILVRDSKNGESRHVPMDATLAALFRAYPHRLGTDLVFSSSSGGHIVDVRTGFQNACKRAGLTDLHFHDLRHTFASQFVMAGGDLYILKEIFGHKSITMTQRYAHLSPAYKAKATDHLNNIWGTTNPGTSDFGTLIWPHFGRLIWPHLIYSDRSSYPVPASRDGEGDGQETQGGTV